MVSAWKARLDDFEKRLNKAEASGDANAIQEAAKIFSHVRVRKRTVRFPKDKIDAWVRARTFVPSALRGQDDHEGDDSSTATPGSSGANEERGGYLLELLTKQQQHSDLLVFLSSNIFNGAPFL